MNNSRFTTEEKLRILKEKEALQISVEEICVRHSISMPTYYNWRRKLSPDLKDSLKDNKPIDLKSENNVLRKLYIDLSEHNYKLAKFLSQ